MAFKYHSIYLSSIDFASKLKKELNKPRTSRGTLLIIFPFPDLIEEGATAGFVQNTDSEDDEPGQDLEGVVGICC